MATRMYVDYLVHASHIMDMAKQDMLRDMLLAIKVMSATHFGTTIMPNKVAVFGMIIIFFTHAPITLPVIIISMKEGFESDNDNEMNKLYPTSVSRWCNCVIPVCLFSTSSFYS